MLNLKRYFPEYNKLTGAEKYFGENNKKKLFPFDFLGNLFPYAK